MKEEEKEVSKNLKKHLNLGDKIKLFLGYVNVGLSFLFVALPIILAYAVVIVALFAVSIPLLVIFTLSCLINWNFRKFWHLYLLSYIKVWRESLTAFKSLERKK